MSLSIEAITTTNDANGAGSSENGSTLTGPAAGSAGRLVSRWEIEPSAPQAEYSGNGAATHAVVTGPKSGLRKLGFTGGSTPAASKAAVMATSPTSGPRYATWQVTTVVGLRTP